MSKRRAAREFCLQFLYHFQLPIFEEEKTKLPFNDDPSDLFEQIQTYKETLQIDLAPEDQIFVISIIRGMLKEAKTCENLLQPYLKNWKLHRLSKIELTLLLMSFYELKFQPETPHKVVINEAIEIAKKYSTPEAGSFINGILDAFYKNEIKK